MYTQLFDLEGGASGSAKRKSFHSLICDPEGNTIIIIIIFWIALNIGHLVQLVLQ
jgi:hypothetical protein